MNSIRTRLSLLGRKGNDREYLQESVGVLQGQIDRIARIVHGVSQFGRLQQESWSTWEMNALVEEVVELVRLDRRSHSKRFDLQLPVPSSMVRGARDQISQVLLNLVLNAVEAESEGGKILVGVSQGQDWVEVSIRDNGQGIPEPDRPRLFEPFFTTKEKGSGLGLSISYSLVQAHQGELFLDDDCEGGSRFVLRLLRSKPSARELSTI